MMRTVISVLALCLLLSAVPARAVDVQMKYKRITGGGESVFPLTWRTLSKTLTPPDGSWKWPELKSEYPLYAMVPMGEGERLLVVDRRSSNDPFYNLVYFDANGNKDLTDDPVISEDPDAGKDPTVPHPYTIKDVTAPQKNGSARYSFRVNVNYKSRKKKGKLSKSTVQRSIKLQVAADCLYEGELKLGNKTYGISLGDLNGNGRFDDPINPPDSSVLALGTKISVGGDGIFLAEKSQANIEGILPFGDLLFMDGEVFQVDLDLGSGLLALRPHEGNSTKMTIPMATERLGMYTEDGAHYVMMYGPVSEVMIPPGKYRLDRYVTLRKDDAGDEWFLAATATGMSPCVQAVNGETARLDLGEPYLAYVSVPEWSQQGVAQGYSKQASLEFVIEGKGREQVTELIRVSGGKTRIPLSHEEKQRPREPRVKVINDGGKVAFESDFKYG